MKTKTSTTLALAILLLPFLTGCSFVTSAQGGTDQMTGEAWYVRTGLFSNARIYYCPPGGTTCYKATMQK